MFPHAGSRWQHYLELINSSLAGLTDCWSETKEEECGCYGSVIESDLQVWRERGGIKWEEFEAAKQPSYRAVHYQVIDHELYRQEECMFGPRCAGRLGVLRGCKLFHHSAGVRALNTFCLRYLMACRTWK